MYITLHFALSIHVPAFTSVLQWHNVTTSKQLLNFCTTGTDHPTIANKHERDFFNLQGLSWSSGYLQALCFGIHSFSSWLKTATLLLCLSQLRSGKVGMHLLENLYQLTWTATWVNRNPNHRATGLIIYIREIWSLCLVRSSNWVLLLPWRLPFRRWTWLPRSSPTPRTLNESLYSPTS